MTPPVPWIAQSECRPEDGDLFFPEGTGYEAHVAMTKAVAICRRCPVMEACRAYALRAGEEHGVWGGLMPRQRRALRRDGTRRAS